MDICVLVSFLVVWGIFIFGPCFIYLFLLVILYMDIPNLLGSDPPRYLGV